ncbi:hypothetical protein CR513_06729, partial [Mucuna pruriens]
MAHLVGVSLILVLLETLVPKEAVKVQFRGRSQAPTVSQASRRGSVGSMEDRDIVHTSAKLEICNEWGHISRDCPRARQESTATSGSASGSASKPKATGRVFALSGTEAAQSDDLIQ